MKSISKKIGILSLIAFAAGIAAGLLIPEFCISIEVLGTVYVNLLKIMIVPVIFTEITSALARDTENISRITMTTIIVFITMFIVSFIICSLLWTAIRPGAGVVFNEIAWEGDLDELSFGAFLLSMFPSNILTAMSSNALLPTIIFAFVFGIAIRQCKLSKLRDVIAELDTAFGKMLSYVMYLTPIGAFALISNTVAQYGSRILGTAAVYIGCGYLGCVVIMILVMILPVWIYCKISPAEYIKKAYKVWVLTLTTCSSAATLPTTIKVCNEDFGVPEKITKIVVPLGCTIHMCGGAVSFSLLAMFNIQMMGLTVTPGFMLLMVLFALLLNMAAPGLPGGGIVVGATYLSLLGIPLTFIGFYAGIYRILDMAYTTMNVCGDITANVLINKINEKTV